MMRKSLLIAAVSLATCLATASSMAQTGAAQPAAVPAAAADPLQVEHQHDFGSIRLGRPVTYTFEVTNTGRDSLHLENVSASCGCTTPEWTAGAVAPGKKTGIKVGYNAASEGPFEKSITLVYNGGQSKTIFIKGNVEKALPAVPLNASVELLKQNK